MRNKAVVTGANSGIGEAIAKRLAADGAQVLLVARKAEALNRVAADIQAAGGGKSAEEIAATLAESSRRSGTVRVGEPEDVASLVAYILSPAGELLQGAIIDLDGGATKGM